MPHLNIYVEDNLLKYIKTSAKIQKLSMSKWIQNKIIANREKSKWPENYFDVFGSITDETFKRPKQPPLSADAPREEL